MASLYDWDTSRLDTTGEVTLLAAAGVLAGDANGDGQVDVTDFGTLKNHFGAQGARSEGDANGDGQIDRADFGLLKLNFGKSTPGNPAAVPEPSGLVLALGAAALGVLVYRLRPLFSRRKLTREVTLELHFAPLRASTRRVSRENGS